VTLTYLLPLRRDLAAEQADSELVRYLTAVSEFVGDLLVVDGSPPSIFEHHAELLAPLARHVAPHPRDRCANGKAWGVLTGLDLARHDCVVIADDDVRWDAGTLRRAAELMTTCDLLLPANFFAPMAWHAAWDTARILVNRATAHDWPGTMVLRRSALTASPRYDGNVLFENLELMRTVEACGGRVQVVQDLFVARRPPTSRHFLGQRPRQAYDDLAQPARLAVMLAIVPAAVLVPRRAIVVGVALSIALAETGRRRAHGRRVFPWYASLLAPAWLAERGLLSWWAVWLRTGGGGVSYSGSELLRAANRPRVLRARTRAGVRS
jgi:hypothetical protein